MAWTGSSVRPSASVPRVVSPTTKPRRRMAGSPTSRSSSASRAQRADGDSRRERRGRRRRAHRLRERRTEVGEVVWQDLCRGRALPHTLAHPLERQRVEAHARVRRPTGAAPRRTRSCSASTARRGRTRSSSRRTSSGSRRQRSATTASSVPSSTCSRSPTRSARAWRSSTRRAASSAARWRTTRAAGTNRRATPSSTRRTSPRRLFEQSGHLGWYKDGMFPAMHMDQLDGRGRQRHAAGGGLLPQADELPDAHPAYRSQARSYRDCRCSAMFRVRHGLPQRESPASSTASRASAA